MKPLYQFCISRLLKWVHSNSSWISSFLSLVFLCPITVSRNRGITQFCHASRNLVFTKPNSLKLKTGDIVKIDNDTSVIIQIIKKVKRYLTDLLIFCDCKLVYLNPQLFRTNRLKRLHTELWTCMDHYLTISHRRRRECLRIVTETKSRWLSRYSQSLRSLIVLVKLHWWLFEKIKQNCSICDSETSTILAAILKTESRHWRERSSWPISARHFR